MIFDLQKMIASKKALRQRHAALPLEEKLRMLDAMRERAIAIKKTVRKPGAPVSPREL